MRDGSDFTTLYLPHGCQSWCGLSEMRKFVSFMGIRIGGELIGVINDLNRNTESSTSRRLSLYLHNT